MIQKMCLLPFFLGINCVIPKIVTLYFVHNLESLIDKHLSVNISNHLKSNIITLQHRILRRNKNRFLSGSAKGQS